jgi:hypothetical protein
MLTLKQFLKKFCPFKSFNGLDLCVERKCPHVVYLNGKPHGCKLWMNQTGQTLE